MEKQKTQQFAKFYIKDMKTKSQKPNIEEFNLLKLSS
tara:strand:- start:513 stop:623 length:111 start_codon:yes stop_codon:yes gene_type:complete